MSEDSNFRPLEPAKTSSFDVKPNSSVPSTTSLSGNHFTHLNPYGNMMTLNDSNSAQSLEESGYYSASHADSPFAIQIIGDSNSRAREFSTEPDQVHFSLESSSQVDEDELELMEELFVRESNVPQYSNRGVFSAVSSLGFPCASRIRADSPSIFRHVSTQTQAAAALRIHSAMRPNSAPIDFFEEIEEESEADIEMEDNDWPMDGEVFNFSLENDFDDESPRSQRQRGPIPDLIDSTIGRSRVRSNTTGSELAIRARRSNRCHSVPSLMMPNEEIMQRVGDQLRQFGDDIYSGRISLSSTSSFNIHISHSAESNSGRRFSSIISSSLDIFGRYCGINNSSIDMSPHSNKNSK